jgi:hypothetical protein
MRKTDIYCQISGIELGARGDGDDRASDGAVSGKVFRFCQVFGSLL